MTDNHKALLKQLVEAKADVAFLVGWVSGHIQKMHRDIPDEERSRLADDMCCDWVNTGIGASYAAAIEQMEPTE